MSKTVFDPCDEYNLMQIKWRMIHTLLGGTYQMRLARELYLPKGLKERQDLYDERLNRSYVYPGLKMAIRRAVGKPFSRPVVLKKSDEFIDELAENMDLQGSNLTSFAQDCFESGLKYGKIHIFVDYPKIGTNLSLGEEKEIGARPIFRNIKAPDLIGWTYETINGVKELSEIRIKETRTEKDDDWGQVTKDYVRVIRRNEWMLFRKNSDGIAILEDSGPLTFGKIPLVSCYFDQLGFMVADPPFEDLAYLNIAHWQSQSDQQNFLRIIRCGILLSKGFQNGEAENIVVGPNSKIDTENPDAKLEWIEHQGKAADAGRQDLLDKQQQMEVLGMAPFVEKSGNQTATAKAIDDANSQSDIQGWIRKLEHTLEEAFCLGVEWVKSELQEGFAVDIFNDFGLGQRNQTDITALQNMRAKVPPDIDRDTYLHEMKRRGVLGDDVDVADISVKLGEEIDLGAVSSPIGKDENGQLNDQG